MIQGADTIPSFVDMAAKVSSGWSLAAFAIAAVLAVVTGVAGGTTGGKGRRRGRPPALAWGAIGAIVLLAVVPIVARAVAEGPVPGSAVYRVRATVVDTRDMPVGADSVWSDVGGEWQRVSGGWEVTIPEATLPAHRRLVVRAARPDAFETALDTLTLGADRNPTLTLRLRADTTATVRGTVVDARGQAVAGARVSVDGYGAEGVVTDSTGSFVLPAHGAEGQVVRLRARKDGVGAVELDHRAGRTPATLELDPSWP